jgi:ribosomal protein S18 acetylase RimI-like enzyme
MSEAPALPLYTVERGEVARDRDTVLGIWRGNLGRDERMRAKFDWFYCSCPFGEPLLVLLRHAASDALVGVAAIGPRRMLWGTREVAAGVLVDLAVSPEHRSLGPALMLERELAAAGGARFDLLYGFPNLKATALLKRLGVYEPLGSIVRYARVLRYRDYVARRLPDALAMPLGAAIDLAQRIGRALRARGERRIVASWGDASDPRIDALWARSTHGDEILGIRDSTFLRWRFDNSQTQTSFLLLSDPADGTLLAWFACQAREKVLHVRDVWSDDASRGIGRAYVSALLRAAYRAGYAAVSFEFAGADAKLASWKAAGFVERSRRPVYGKWTGAATAADLQASLHLTSADEDE